MTTGRSRQNTPGRRPPNSSQPRTTCSSPRSLAKGMRSKRKASRLFPSTTSPDTSPRWEPTTSVAPSPKTCVPKSTRTRCFASTCSACCCRPPSLRTATRWCFRICFKNEESITQGPKLLVSFGSDATKRAEAQLPLDNSSNNGVSVRAQRMHRRPLVYIRRNGAGYPGACQNRLLRFRNARSEAVAYRSIERNGIVDFERKLDRHRQKHHEHYERRRLSPRGRNRPHGRSFDSLCAHRTDRYAENRSRNPPRPLNASERRWRPRSTRASQYGI